MQYIILSFLAIAFLFFNYKIIASDLKYKKIPNKYLLYLLFLIPFYYIYLIFYFPDINYLIFLWQIILTFLISFILFNFGIWAAGDAKYLLVLSLFIPYIGIIPFIGNLALLTLSYLFLYFLWFYFGKCIFYKGYAKSLWGNIKIDLNSKWQVYKGNKGGKTFFIIFKWLIIFLLIFVSIRLARLYLFASIFENKSFFGLLQNFLEKYHFYLVFLFIGLFIGSLYLVKLVINKSKKFLIKRLKINTGFVGNIFLSILFIALLSFIIFEYIKNPQEIKIYLIRIFTIYIALYLFLKIITYSYKITFGIAESRYINIKDLKEGDVVDKNYLSKHLIKYHNINYIEKKGIKIPKKIRQQIQEQNFIESYKKINTLNNKKKLLRKNIIITQKIVSLYKEKIEDIKIL